MLVIGITGSIAAGKSTVCSILTGMGYQVIDADEIAPRILEEDDDVWAAIAARYGEDVVDAEGRIDRSSLGRIVFGDAQEKAFLESTLHPGIEETLNSTIENLQGKTKDDLLFIEAALIFQSGFENRYDGIWLITATAEDQKNRLVATRQMSEEEATTRIEAIAPLSAEQIARCQHIDNSQTFQYTEQQVEKLVARTLKRLKDGTDDVREGS